MEMTAVFLKDYFTVIVIMSLGFKVGCNLRTGVKKQEGYTYNFWCTFELTNLWGGDK